LRALAPHSLHANKGRSEGSFEVDLMRSRALVISLGIAVAIALACAAAARRRPAKTPAREVPTPRNIVLILSDDHRYDFMGFMASAPRWLETPAMDRMRREGAHLKNAFVTTSLCSPSRASILTGRYAHRHGVVDNTSPIPPGTVFFPEHLQQAGYRTAFVGKWHMGEDEESDKPRPGFDHWLSFRGQGVYVDPAFNVNGEQRQLRGYTTDLLTEEAIAWLRRHRHESPDRPFFLFLSHKAAHAEFVPAPRHAGRYARSPIPYPATMANSDSNYRNKPRWVREQRYSWHGVDFMYHGQMDFDQFYRRYNETILALDESIGRVLDYLEESGLARSTLVVYMGDNGFVLGEHGLIDKRHAYEESMRVPMLVWAPGFIAAGGTITAMVRNIDVAPTLLELAGAQSSVSMDGHSVLPALRGEPMTAAVELLYEYYWEYAFPHTPTTFALRGDRYKYIFYHGVWDTNELYDLQADPEERDNLIGSPGLQGIVAEMRDRLFGRLEATDGMRIPVRRGSWQAAERKVP
jgi:N-acetylglucosamine-6-sulfatase